MDDYQYLLLMAGCAALTLPLEWIGRGVYRRPRRLLTAMAVPIALFLVWDAVAIARGHWWFEEQYVTGIRLLADIPIEEVVFFLVIPICTLLTFEAVRRLWPETRERNRA